MPYIHRATYCVHDPRYAGWSRWVHSESATSDMEFVSLPSRPAQPVLSIEDVIVLQVNTTFLIQSFRIHRKPIHFARPTYHLLYLDWTAHEPNNWSHRLTWPVRDLRAFRQPQISSALNMPLSKDVELPAYGVWLAVGSISSHRDKCWSSRTCSRGEFSLCYRG